MQPCQVLALAGSGVAFVAAMGTSGFAWMHKHGHAHVFGAAVAGNIAPADANTVIVTGVVTSLTALVTAIGAQVFPIIKLWFENRSAERQARWERHDLRNQLQAAKFELTQLRADAARKDKKIDINSESLNQLKSLLVPDARATDQPPTPQG